MIEPSKRENKSKTTNQPTDRPTNQLTNHSPLPTRIAVYEEAIRVPLVFSNPKLFPRPLRTSALVSHVDLAPTLASLLGTPKEKLPKYKFTGRDYSSILLDPVRAKPVQDYGARGLSLGRSVGRGECRCRSHRTTQLTTRRLQFVSNRSYVYVRRL